MSPIDLDQLEARAELVEYNSSSNSSVSGSDAELSGSDRDLHNYAAVRPTKQRKLEQYDSDDDGEFDPNQYDMQYLESARHFLMNDHLEAFNGMISRWENSHLIEEGDDIDLNTGKIVQNHGHLNALNPSRNKDLALFFGGNGSDSDEEDEETGENEAYDSDFELMASEARRDGRPGPVYGVTDEDEEELGADLLYVVCDAKAPLLDSIVQYSTRRWIL